MSSTAEGQEMEMVTHGGDPTENIGLTRDNWRQDSSETFLDLFFKEFTWPEIKKNFSFVDFLVNLVFSTLPSFWDVFSDLLLAYAFYQTDDDLLLASLTLLFIFLPGLEWLSFKNQGKAKWRLLFIISCIFFPFFLLTFKVKNALHHAFHPHID